MSEPDKYQYNLHYYPDLGFCVSRSGKGEHSMYCGTRGEWHRKAEGLWTRDVEGLIQKIALMDGVNQLSATSVDIYFSMNIDTHIRRADAATLRAKAEAPASKRVLELDIKEPPC